MRPQTIRIGRPLKASPNATRRSGGPTAEHSVAALGYELRAAELPRLADPPALVTEA